MVEGRYINLGRFDAEFLNQVISLLGLSGTEERFYRERFLREYRRYSDKGRKKGEPRNEGCVWELEGLDYFDIRTPKILARWLKEHQHTKYQKDNVRRERNSFLKQF